ncbi:MAG: hypothetical protein JXR67_01585 [Bacteroidales bacterium]|nr:hypothetical protein [Bacteroidales bacterium]
MTRPSPYHPVILFFLVFLPYSLSGNTDTLLKQNNPGRDVLLNGRIWWNKHAKVTGDPFFISDSYLKGSVTFNGQSFGNLYLKYDICSDELVYKPESHPVILLNKEMTDSFKITYGFRDYIFFNTGSTPESGPAGYINMLYKGPTSLLVKYAKKIQPLADQGIYDLFHQEHKIFIRKDTTIIPVTGRKHLMSILGDKKKEVREYRKQNRHRISLKEPDSLVPVLEFYDSLSR